MKFEGPWKLLELQYEKIVGTLHKENYMSLILCSKVEALIKYMLLEVQIFRLFCIVPKFCYNISSSCEFYLSVNL